MAQFIMKVNGAKADLSAEEEIQKKLEIIQQSVLDVSGGLNFKSASTAEIKKNLTTLAGRVERYKNGMCSMKNALGRAISLYEKTEKEVCGYAIGTPVSNSHGADEESGRTIDEESTAPSESITENNNAQSESIAYLNEHVGSVIANIEGDCYCSNRNMSYASGYKGQCTWYAYGRFMEVTGIAFNTAHRAKRWLNDNVGDSRVNISHGVENISSPAVAVNTESEFGHVLFVEGVEYNADGTPANVYITEANYRGVQDGILQKLSYEEFMKRGVVGYITAASVKTS